ncbi:MAG: hypothetical protein J5697_02520 [Clostridia bacterium]|nr:hypothetical protein [Clostridia bacterium]
MKKHLDLIVLGCSALFSVVVLLMMLATGMKSTVPVLGSATWSVYDLMNFGDTTRVGIVLALVFTILSLLAAIVLLCVKAFKVKCKFAWIVALIVALLALVSGILFFCAKSLVVTDDYPLVTFNLGIGAVFCGIFSLLNAAALIYYGIKAKK